jgi:hypothetical protein
MKRPRRTKPDQVQNQENNKLREYGCRCIILSDLPGKRHKGPALENPLDTLVLSPCHRFFLLVEYKNGPLDDFTENEVEFFDSLGLWPVVYPPVIMWCKYGVPVIAAWMAEQIMEVFEAMEEACQR